MGRVRLTIALLVLCVCGTTSCLFRSHVVAPKRSLAPLKTATQAELVARINDWAASVQSMSATVDIDTTVGGEKKGKVIEYQQIRGYILAEKPKMLRMIGLLPIVRNRAFDMVSDGDRFKLSIPPKNRFVTGKDEITTVSANSLENLRPKVIYDALLMPAIDEKNEIVILEEGAQQVEDGKTHKMVTQPNYHLMVIRHGEQNTWHIYRKIYFNRTGLEIYRQTIYDDTGAVATDAVYSNLREYNGVKFPSLVEIERPQEEYRIAIKMIKLALNTPLKPEQFQMDVPPGAKVTELK
jgi:outer membrane lipoprotein-sorting protein